MSRTSLGATALALALASTAHAAPVTEPDPPEILREVLDEALQTYPSELTLPDSPGIYHLRYKLLSLQQLDVHASFGGLRRVRRDPQHALGIEVRVGDATYDNTGFGGWSNGFGGTWLPRVPTAYTLSLDAWRLTDEAFKEAVGQYARKVAQAVLPPDHPDSYTLVDAPVVYDAAPPSLSPADPLVDLAVRMSSAMGATPGLERADVFVGHEAGTAWIADTEGTRVTRPMAELTLRAVAHRVAEDGMLLTAHRLWTVRSADDLPPAQSMVDEVSAMVDDLTALAEAPTFEDEYVGPVVLRGEAAAELYRGLLTPQLEGTPPMIAFDTFLGDIGERGGGARLGRRVLPVGWSVVDDPRAHPEHPGSTTHDAEGTPARAVSLVDDGIVRRLVTSRTPRSDTEGGSTGHGRMSIARPARPKTCLTEITPRRAVSERALMRKALKLSASYGHDHVIVIERVQPTGLAALADPERAWGGETAFAQPLAVTRVYADGRRERLRGAKLAGIDRWALRDIMAAGPSRAHDYMSSLTGDDSGLSPTEGTPCRIVGPSVLVGELELVPAAADPSDVHLLPPPTLSIHEESP